MKNIFVLYITFLLFGISACTPKVGVLRSPEYKGDVGAGTDTKANRDDASDKAVKDAEASKKNLLKSSVALVLPFQLEQISTSAIMEKDVKRSALALDFYQGFQLGLEESSKNGKDFALHVLDSRDNDIQNATRSEEHTSELQSRENLVCRLLLEKKKMM